MIAIMNSGFLFLFVFWFQPYYWEKAEMIKYMLVKITH